MEEQQMPYSTIKIDFANYLKYVKQRGLPDHDRNDRGLTVFTFENVSREQADLWWKEYVNSEWKGYDVSKHDLLELVKKDKRQ